MNSACRAFIMRLSIKYADGSTQDVVTLPTPSLPGPSLSVDPYKQNTQQTTPKIGSAELSPAPSTSSSAQGVWKGNNDANPLVYSHLYHGEIYDARMANGRSYGWNMPPSSSRPPPPSTHPTPSSTPLATPPASLHSMIDWQSVQEYRNSTSYEGPRQATMSLHSMPSMGTVGGARQASTIRVSPYTIRVNPYTIRVSLYTIRVNPDTINPTL
jgi:hypothetical protein